MRSLNRQTTHTEVDLDTGEMRRIVTDDFKGYIDQEPDYVKIYVGTQLCLNKLDHSLAPLVMAISPFMTYANDSQYTHMITINDSVIDYMAKYMDVTYQSAKHYTKRLVEAGILIPMYKRVETDGIITQKKKRGQYFVNPWVIAKGSWKDIKKLQQQIDFVKGAVSYCMEDELGERKIQVNLPDNYQFTIADYQKGLMG